MKETTKDGWKKILDEVFYDDEDRSRREYCIICHQMTDYYLDTPIDRRMYYYEGAGQLCDRCWKKVFRNQ